MKMGAEGREGENGRKKDERKGRKKEERKGRRGFWSTVGSLTRLNANDGSLKFRPHPWEDDDDVDEF